MTTRLTEVRGQLTSRLNFPLREFIQAETAGGIVLLASAIIALLWANSAWSAAYTDLWATPMTVGPGDLALSKSLGHWINDGLMAVFFFVVGLEIKREVLVGELASPRRAALPIVAALGGALVPAALYAAFNAGTSGGRGWGIPMATDIAFALGALALLGSRVPPALKVFLTALAIVDDLVAVLVIAIFYTANIAWTALAIGAVIFAILLMLNRCHVRHPLAYALLGVGLWVAFLESGVHATIAGVLVALTIPARTRLDPAEFLTRARALLDDFAGASVADRPAGINHAQQAVVLELEAACEGVETPLQRLEHAVHPWAAFAIMPLFALANAGISLSGDLTASLGNRVTLGVIVGLVLGKQLGVTLFAWLAIRGGLATLPDGIRWRHIYGASWLAGIGFTMSLFIAELAFDDASRLTDSKLGILLASVTAGLVGLLILRPGEPTAD